MATSGSTNFVTTRDDLIKASLRIVGGVASGGTPTSDQYTEAALALNMLTKSLQNDGCNLWGRKWEQATFTASDIVSNNSVNYRAKRTHTSGATDEPGVGANWSTYWEVTTATAGGAWATSTAYDSIGEVLLGTDVIGIEEAFIRENDADFPLVIKPFAEYLKINDKTYYGVPDYLYVDEYLDTTTALTRLRVHLYPMPEDTDMVLHVLVNKTPDDFDASGDNPYFPPRWYEVLKYGLAYKIAPEFGIFGEQLGNIRVMYQEALKDARKEDKEVLVGFCSPAYDC